MTQEIHTEQKSKLTLGKSHRQQITGLKVNGIDARGLVGKSNTMAITTKGGKIALDLGAFAQVIELPSEMANKSSVKIEFEVSTVPGPQ